MGLLEVAAIIAVAVLTFSCAGVVAVFAVAATAHRSRGQGWGHLLGSAVRLTLVLAAVALAVELAVIVLGAAIT
ncbi:hypothetical protein [Jiangella alkaliphila]|uniref:Uncharacterized protein n=1 Tax=Jiangella alkaliphila TaxID=419479 RepID=A0A1H2GAL4_9ACTN|nr:hypothetical protein [Jiangella alkaliphila]SDU16554.1 hypothetical protein SAMN04488563_0388 [Jiangella alkaliphila]